MIKVLMMNSGVEAVETAMKLVRKWAYKVKKIEENKSNTVLQTVIFMGEQLVSFQLQQIHLPI